MLDRQLENPPCRVSLDKPGSVSCGSRSTTTTSHSLDPLPSLSRPCHGNPPTPTHALQGSAADQTADCPRTPVIASKSCLGQGKHRCGPGHPWSFFTLSPWVLSAILASMGDGATVPIHTTMAQRLLFSNSGRNLEPIRRRMARRGMRVASEAYTVPYQCNNPCPD